jgi:WD40 repeat protein/biotin carboxyl carrier protein
MRRNVGLAIIATVLVSLGLWWSRVGSNRTDGVAIPAEVNVAATAGPSPAPLRVPVTGRFDSIDPARPLYDPISVGPCNLVPLEEQEVASQVDGTIKDLRIELGQKVAAGELLAQLDDGQLRPQVELLRIKAASESSKLIAKAQLDDIQSKLVTAETLLARKAMAREEYRSLQCQRDRFAEELKKAKEDQTMASKELDKVQHSLEQHQVRSAIAGEVTKVYKRSGESVRQAETLFSVAKLDRLRVEGLCKVQQAALIKVGMHAVVEPEVRGEQMTALSGHTATINGLAISADGRVLASASDDRTVRLWNVGTRAYLAALPHPTEVTAVTFVQGPDSQRLLSGAGDGRVRLWVPRPGGTPEATPLTGSHEAAIRAIGSNHDGTLCATGGEDRRIGVWDVGAGKLRYWVHAREEGLEIAHRGAVTSVHFTPDGHLVSAGRDNTLKVWQLGPDGATLVALQPGRTGDVVQLGVSPDGRRLLFDHGEELRLLDWTDGSSQGSLRSRRQGRFQAFATFSPSGRLLLTAGNNGQLQLWNAPAQPQQVNAVRQGYSFGFRRDALAGMLSPFAAMAPVPQLWLIDGYELRQFQQPSPAALTCGVFAPDETVVFAAGVDRLIHVWAVPPASQWQQPLEATITYVGSQVERGTDMVRIRAELDNPADPARRLRPGMYAHLRLYPETAR